MTVKKKRKTQKTKKKIVKKIKHHKAEEKKPESPEIQHDTPMSPQAPISESVGGTTVVSSGVIQDSPKETPQAEPVLPKVEPPASVPPQPTPQAADTLVSQPESATSVIPSVEPIATQNPFAVDGVVRDKPEENIEEPKKKRSLIIIALIIAGIVFIGGVLWYFRENAAKQISMSDKVTSTPSPSKVTPTPASDSAKLIDYSKYKIKVLNGSGIGGAAAKGKEILEKELFMVVEVGNAETSDFDLTVIQAKKDVPKAFLEKLKGLLEKTYKIAPNEELKDKEEVDVIITIGSGKKQQ